MARILALPGELRNCIYGFATYEDTPIDICCKRHQPASSFVNKQLREECLPVFYSVNPVMAKKWGVSSARLERVLKFAKHIQAVEAVSGDELVIAMRTSKENEAHKWVYFHDGDHRMFVTRNVAIRTIDNLLRLLGILGTEKDDHFWTSPLAELRNRIYGFIILRRDHPVRVHVRHHPVLSMVNRQLRHETLSMFYSINTIDVDPWDDNEEATIRMLKPHARYISSISALHYFNGDGNASLATRDDTPDRRHGWTFKYYYQKDGRWRDETAAHTMELWLSKLGFDVDREFKAFMGTRTKNNRLDGT